MTYLHTALRCVHPSFDYEGREVEVKGNTKCVHCGQEASSIFAEFHCQPPTLFLDIDGVLNSADWYDRQGEEYIGQVRPDWMRPTDWWALDPKAIERLNTVMRRTDCLVVVSSTWRLLHEWSELIAMLKARGIKVDDK